MSLTASYSFGGGVPELSFSEELPFSMTVVARGSRKFEAFENFRLLPTLPLDEPPAFNPINGALYDIFGLKFLDDVLLTDILAIDLFKFG
jgi:hypothetical protein